MKRILFSGTIAICFHIAFFLFLPILLQTKHKPVRPEIKSVMVTMSYRPMKDKKEKIKKIKKPRPEPEKKEKLKKPKPVQKKKKLPVQKPAPKPVQKSVQQPAPKPEPVSKIDPTPLPPPLTEPETKEKPACNQIAQKKTPNLKSQAGLNKNKESIIITEPIYKKNILPRYPVRARKRGYEGTVELMVEVSEKGRVTNLWIFKSSNYKSLDNQAVKTVKKWIFKPGEKNGKPETMWVKIPIKFKLKS